MRTPLFAIAAAVAALTGQVRESVRVALPATVSNATCTVKRDGAPVARVQGPPLVFSCPAGSDKDIVSCDLEGAEPVDVPAADICRTRAIAVQPAEMTAFLTDGRTPVTVQWLIFGAQGRGVPVVATRQLDGAARQRVFVARREDRFIRLSRPGASPVTVRAADLFGRTEFALPPPVAGGELVARVETQGVAPELYRLSGEHDADLRSDGDLLLLRGLPAGRYQLTPVYPGGVNGRTRPVPIADGLSTAFYIRAEKVGAVQVTGEAAVCREASALRITRIEASSSAAGTFTARRNVARVALEGGCSHTVGGLAPGSYEASYVGTRGAAGTARFAVEAGVIASAFVGAPTARLFGRILVNGAAAGDVTVTLVRASGEPGGGGAQAVSDAQGFYEMTIARPGAFRVSFSRNGVDYLASERSALIGEGDNQIDWQIQSGRLKVTIDGWDRASPVALTIKRVTITEPGQASTALRVLPTDQMPIVVEGLGYEQYLVEARQHDPASPSADRIGSAVAKLERDRGETSVEIQLRPSDRVLSLADAQGNPAPGATVLVAMGEPLPEISPGEYSLADVAPGTFLTIVARGFAPTCRPAPASSQQVQLDPGMTVRVRFSGRSDLHGQLPGQLLWGGSACPVPLSRFDFAAVPSTSAGVAEFVVKAFPLAPEFVFIATPFDTADKWQRVRVDGDGVLQIRLPDGR